MFSDAVQTKGIQTQNKGYFRQDCCWHLPNDRNFI